MTRHSLTALVALALALPAPAHAFRALNRSEVVPLGNGLFEVINSFGSRTQDYWCGAGDFAIRVLRAPVTQRIYIWAPRGPSKSRPGRKAVTFSLKEPPGGAAPKSYSLSVTTVGESIPASMAQNYCYDRMQLLF